MCCVFYDDESSYTKGSHCSQVVNLNTTFKGNTAKGRLFKEFFVTEGLCRDGFYFSEIKENFLTLC